MILKNICVSSLQFEMISRKMCQKRFQHIKFQKNLFLIKKKTYQLKACLFVTDKMAIQISAGQHRSVFFEKFNNNNLIIINLIQNII